MSLSKKVVMGASNLSSLTRMSSARNARVPESSLGVSSVSAKTAKASAKTGRTSSVIPVMASASSRSGAVLVSEQAMAKLQ